MKKPCDSAQAEFRMDVLDSGPIDGFVGYFDVQFRGSPENPADYEARISRENHVAQNVNKTCKQGAGQNAGPA